MDELIKKMRALLDTAKAENRELNADEIKTYDGLKAQFEAAKATEQRNAELAAIETANTNTEEQERHAAMERDIREAKPGTSRVSKPDDMEERVRIEIPRQSVRNFRTVEGEKPAHERAFRFGQFCLAAFGNQNAARYCADNGIQVRGHIEGTNTLGGFLVPDEFDADMIDLRERFGVFRRNARVVPMSSDTKSRRRRDGGLTSYFVGEGQEGTTSTKAWGMVQLVAKKLMVLSTYSNELNEDAAVNIGDDLISEIAYAFSLKEDQCGFLGDGTSTYGGILGAIPKINGLAPVGLQTATSASHTDWSKITIRDFEKCVGILPEYADVSPNVKWYCSKAFYANTMSALAYAAGGNTTESIGNGVRKTFLGYPVEISQVFPKTAAAAEVVCLFGDLRMAADFGDRRINTIAFSEDATVDGVSVFETDEVAIRGTTRFDINVHSVGDSTNAGPLAALKTSA
jgi:HK97 family phage major capsid protein